jgi:hypothetical protein
MMSISSPATRTRRNSDQRLREHVVRAGARSLGQRLTIPRSTVSTWHRECDCMGDHLPRLAGLVNDILGPLMQRASSHKVPAGLLARLSLAMALLAGNRDAYGDRVAGQCPLLSDVVAGLGQVLTTKQAEDLASEVVIHDQGASWSIEVRGHASTYSDPARDCAERVRVATVFAALALEPIEADEAPVASVAAERPSARFSVEAGPQLTLATWAHAHNTPVGLGGQARLNRSGEHLGVSLGIEAVAFSKLDLGWYGASIARAACDGSGRMSWATGSLVMAAELGPYLALLRVRGRGLDQTSSSYRLDVGARGAFGVRLPTRLAPFVALQAELGARRFSLTVAPSGDIGSAPRLWLGLVAGGALDL